MIYTRLPCWFNNICICSPYATTDARNSVSLPNTNLCKLSTERVKLLKSYIINSRFLVRSDTVSIYIISMG